MQQPRSMMMQPRGVSHGRNATESAHTMAVSKRQARTAFDNGKRVGQLEGEQRTRSLVLDFLQAKYMNKDIPRGSVEGEAILKLTRELAELLKATPHGQ